MSCIQQAFFPQQTIKDLFAEPSGVQTLGGLNVHTSISTAKHPDGCGDNIDESICPIKNSTNETNIVAAFEQVMDICCICHCSAMDGYGVWLYVAVG